MNDGGGVGAVGGDGDDRQQDGEDGRQDSHALARGVRVVAIFVWI